MGSEIAEAISALSPDMKRMLAAMVKHAQETGDRSQLEELYKVDYERVPVPPRQFLEDDYYLGKSVKHLSETWKEVFDDVFAPMSRIVTLILTGSIGCGKTTFAAACIARKLYELSCLRDPAQFYGLLPGSKIVFGLFNITIDKADDVAALVRAYVSESAYFAENCPLRVRPQDPMYFPSKRIEISVGSLGSHALGDNLLSFVLDEANFFKKTPTNDSPTEKTRAQQLFNEARSRLTSRFMRKGRIPGLVIMMSSRKFQTSFLDNFIEKVKANPENNRTTKVVELALWQVKNPNDFSGKWINVLVGTEQYASRVLEPDEIAPDGADVIRVPIEYQNNFVEDADLALRDIAGVSTRGTNAFFPVKQRITQCIDKQRVHPFSLPTLSIALGSGARIQDFFLTRSVCKISHSQLVPIVRPEIERHVHIDIAYSDECLSINMAHPFTTNEAKMGAYVDFMLRIRPPTVGEIDLAAAVNFVIFLRTCGYKIKTVSFDQFQSRLPIQLLVQAGFKSELLSVQLMHYVNLKQCFGEKRLSIYEYAPLSEEVDGLLKDPGGGRPHHSPDGLDDVLDGLAAVVSRCYRIEGASRKADQKQRVIVPQRGVMPLIIGVNSERGQEEFRTTI